MRIANLFAIAVTVVLISFVSLYWILNASAPNDNFGQGLPAMVPGIVVIAVICYTVSLKIGNKFLNGKDND